MFKKGLDYNIILLKKLNCFFGNCGEGGLRPTPHRWMSDVQHYIVQAQAAAAAKLNLPETLL